jgi:hypothetical protein
MAKGKTTQQWPWEAALACIHVGAFQVLHSADLGSARILRFTFTSRSAVIVRVEEGLQYRTKISGDQASKKHMAHDRGMSKNSAVVRG